MSAGDPPVTEQQARLQAQEMVQRGRPLGEFIAELLIDDALRCEQTFQPGHYTIWAPQRYFSVA